MKTLRTCLLVIVLTTGIGYMVQAQCPMCSASVESNLKAGGTTGRGLNQGILYLFVMPYLLVGGIGLVWWHNKRRDLEIEQEIEE